MPRRARDETIRVVKHLYEQQDRRCAVCDLEIPHKDDNGRTIRKYEDKDNGVPTGYIVCASCHFLMNYVRKKRGPILDRAIRLMETGKVGHTL